MMTSKDRNENMQRFCYSINTFIFILHAVSCHHTVSSTGLEQKKSISQILFNYHDIVEIPQVQRLA